MSGRRALVTVAVVAAPLAWVAQLVLAYSFEEAACSPGDGSDVWGIGVRTLHVAVAAGAFAVAAGGIAAALALTRDGELEAGERSFLVQFALVGALVFVFTIVLTGVGSTVLATCHGG